VFWGGGLKAKNKLDYALQLKALRISASMGGTLKIESTH
jgi:hypothetical protein